MMKTKFNKLLLFIVAIIFIACDDDELTNVVVDLPQNVSADFKITQDNSGLVTITPTADSASQFKIDFGDGSEPITEIKPGDNVQHVYLEGNYEVEITASNVKGQSKSNSQELVISFLPPENLEATITINPTDPLTISVEAQADFAAGFEVLFGDEAEGEDPTQFMIGEVIEHTYQDVGNFTITVTALSGGEATTSITEEIEIFDPLVFPIDFESETVDYTFNNFGGGEGAGVPIIENPDPNDVNDSPTVASYTKPSGSEVWAGTSAALNEGIDFSSTTSVAIDVYSPAVGTPVLFKVEYSGDASLFSEITVNTTVANEWETLIFTLPDIDQNVTYDVIALFFNFNTSGTGETYLFDNLRTTVLTPIELPLDFEDTSLDFTFLEFGGAPTGVVDNPDQTGENTSLRVVKTEKVQDAQTFAGAFIDLDTPVDFSNNSEIQMKVWSPVPNTTVTLKFEDINNSDNFAEQVVTLTSTNQWETVSFDFSTADASLDLRRMIVFFNNGTVGDGNEYFFDDVTYGGDVNNELMIENFEGTEPTFSSFGDIAPIEVLSNPNSSGSNTTAMTAKLTKTAGSKVWAGASFELDQNLDLDNFSKISVQTYAPISGAVVKLKIETQLGDNGGTTHEVDITNTVANGWEELVYDFSDAPPADYMRIVIFFDFGNQGDDSEYFFDEIKLVN